MSFRTFSGSLNPTTNRMAASVYSSHGDWDSSNFSKDTPNFKKEVGYFYIDKDKKSKFK